jgi:hypothetical protein
VREETFIPNLGCNSFRSKFKVPKAEENSETTTKASYEKQGPVGRPAFDMESNVVGFNYSYFDCKSWPSSLVSLVKQDEVMGTPGINAGVSS